MIHFYISRRGPVTELCCIIFLPLNDSIEVEFASQEPYCT